MWNVLASFSSGLIIITFFLVAGIVYRKRELLPKNNDPTISDFGTITDFRKIIVLGCTLIAFLNFPFSMGLDRLFTNGIGPVLTIVAWLTSICLILTGLTVSKPLGRRHLGSIWSFCVLFYIFELMISFRLLELNQYLGRLLISILLINLVTTGVLLLKIKKIKGIIELTYLGFNSLWLLLVSVFLILG